MEAEKIERMRERLLTCPICMDEYKDPRILPCHHSVCLDCLLEFVRLSTATGRFFRCPQCRADIMVPVGAGIRDFPPNFYISSLLDEIGTKPYNSCCEVCNRNWIVAQFRCIECDMDICKFCIPNHKLVKHNATRGTGIIRIETAPAAELFTSSPPCPDHGEPPNVYCAKCDEVICLSCVCDGHKSHKTTSLIQRLQYVEKKLADDKSTLKEELESIDQDLEKLDEFSDKVSKEYAFTRNAITKHAEELHSMIEDKSRRELHKVDGIEEEFLKELQTCREEFVKYQEQVSNVSSFLEDMQSEDLSLELMHSFNKFKSKLGETKKSVNKNIRFSQLSFWKGTYLFFWGFLLLAFGCTRRSFCQKSYQLCRASHRSRESSSCSRLRGAGRGLLHALGHLWKTLPRMHCPPLLLSILSLTYIAMVTILMVISLVHLAVQYFTIEPRDGDLGENYSANILTGFLLCCFQFGIFCVTVRNAYRVG